MKRILLLLFLLIFSGCDLVRGLETTAPPAASASPTAPTASMTSTPAAQASAPPATDEPPSPTAVQSLILWVPPEFDPGSGTKAGSLLQQRLEAFSRQNGGVRVQVRVKASSGPGGLLESLNASSAVAPLALPSVIALPRSDLETAALKGLIYPMDSLSKEINQADWFDYARQLASVQGATFALPFAGDALVLAYRPAKVLVQPLKWDSIYRMGQVLAFPAGDPQSLFVLALYQSAGGVVEDSQHRPTLQPDLLSKVLQAMADGEARGTFPYWLSQYETSGQVWQAYRDGRVNALVTWTSDYLSNLPPDTTAVPIPVMDTTPLSLATGWGWAIADPIPERRALSVRLAEFLSQGDFLGPWSEAAGCLPTRPSSLAAWSNQSLKTLLSPVAVSAQARPSGDLLASLGPVLKEATLKVLKREVDPTQAAKAASERLALPETK